VTQVEGQQIGVRPHQVRRVADRRKELAQSALTTLAELGYARTSLREIAQNSAFSHGVVHYYFADKFELITFCVSEYKAECVTRYDDLVAMASSPEELRQGFGAAMAATLCDEAPMHRLWYDMRAQSYYEERFREAVTDIDRNLEAMIWRIVSRYAALADLPVAVPSPVAYAVFDGLFQQALLSHLCGDQTAAERLSDQARATLDVVVAGARSPVESG
jgi:AcrR family transcriptional regulator